MRPETINRIRNLAREVCEREGCMLYDLEFTTSQNGRVLRVYVDRREGQVSIDDCANVSRGLNLILDVEDLIPGGSYELEVSSPGIERRLVEPWHFGRALGQKVRVRTNQALAADDPTVKPQTLFDGELVGFENDVLVVKQGTRNWRIPLAAVSKANIRFEVPQGQQPKGKKKR